MGTWTRNPPEKAGLYWVAPWFEPDARIPRLELAEIDPSDHSDPSLTLMKWSEPVLPPPILRTSQDGPWDDLD